MYMYSTDTKPTLNTQVLDYHENFKKIITFTPDLVHIKTNEVGMSVF